MILHTLSCAERSSNYDNSSTDSTALMFYNTISNSLIVMIFVPVPIVCVGNMERRTDRPMEFHVTLNKVRLVFWFRIDSWMFYDNMNR